MLTFGHNLRHAVQSYDVLHTGQTYVKSQKQSSRRPSFTVLYEHTKRQNISQCPRVDFCSLIKKCNCIRIPDLVLQILIIIQFKYFHTIKGPHILVGSAMSERHGWFRLCFSDKLGSIRTDSAATWHTRSTWSCDGKDRGDNLVHGPCRWRTRGRRRRCTSLKRANRSAKLSNTESIWQQI